MGFINKLERKIGRFAIQNLMKYVIACYLLGVAAYYFNASILDFFVLSPAYIMQGQVWRLVSWLLIPSTTQLLFVAIMCFLYYRLGSILEGTWGAFKFNLYFFSGMFFTVAGEFLLYFFYSGPVTTLVSPFYINLSLLLAMAVTYPDMELRLLFAIPVKIKYIGYFYGAYNVYLILTEPNTVRMLIIASLLNFILFFLFVIRNSPFPAVAFRKSRPKYKPERKGRDKRAKDNVHKCVVCARTEVDHPDLDFRYCSKCKGSYEYCQDHLFTHIHKQ